MTSLPISIGGVALWAGCRHACPYGACLQASVVGLGLIAVYSFPALGKLLHCRLAFGFFVNVFVVLFSVPWLSALLSLPVFQMA